MGAAKQAGKDPLDQLDAIGIAYVRYAVTHPSHFRVMFGGVIPEKFEHPQLAEATAGAFLPLVETIAACQEAGYLREGNPSEVAIPLWSTAHGFASLLIDVQGPLETPDVEGIAKRTLEVHDAVYEGLRSRPTTQRHA